MNFPSCPHARMQNPRRYNLLCFQVHSSRNLSSSIRNAFSLKLMLTVTHSGLHAQFVFLKKTILSNALLSPSALLGQINDFSQMSSLIGWLEFWVFGCISLAPNNSFPVSRWTQLVAEAAPLQISSFSRWSFPEFGDVCTHSSDRSTAKKIWLASSACSPVVTRCCSQDSSSRFRHRIRPCKGRRLPSHSPIFSILSLCPHNIALMPKVHHAPSNQKFIGVNLVPET